MSKTLEEVLSELIRELGMEQPNPTQTWFELARQLNDDLFCHGICLIWKLQSRLGTVIEAHRLNPMQAVPRPPELPNYPEGSWHIMGEVSKLYPIIPAQQVIRCLREKNMNLMFVVDEVKKKNKGGTWFPML